MYEGIIVSCMMQNVGNIRQMADVHPDKNKTAYLALDGIKVVFRDKCVKPLFVLDRTEWLDPNLLESA